MNPMGLFAVSAGALIVLPPLVELYLRRSGMVRPNYRGHPIPVGYGLVVLLWSGMALLGAAALRPDQRIEHLFLLTLVIGFGTLGFVDDRWGDRSAGGFRGHLRMLFSERTITTGLIKLVGGAAIAYATTWLILKHGWTDSLLEGAIIALSANAFNLLDLRPGRASALFIVLAIPTVAAAWNVTPSPPPLLLVVLPALVVYFRDARGLVMLGDTGSNLLGAALGGSVILMEPALNSMVCMLAALLTLHVVAEKWSLTKIIERNWLLSFIDRFTGERG